MKTMSLDISAIRSVTAGLDLCDITVCAQNLSTFAA